MRIEVKGLIAAVVAGTAVVGAAYGVSALVVGTHGAAKPTSTVPGAGPNATLTGAALVSQGHAFYTQSCDSCHGTGGAGGYGPSLRHEDLSDIQITLKIKNGVKPRMPAFGGKYSDQQIQALVAYLRSLK